MAHINYDKITRNELELIEEITRRATKGIRRDPDINFMTMMMDIEAVHSQWPLCLEEFLNAPEYDFWHDIYGIRRHLNRETLQLEDGFVPRYTKQEMKKP